MIRPHIHIPFERFYVYLDHILKHEINIEFFFKGEVLDTITEKDVIKVKETLPYEPSLTIHAPFMDLAPGAIDSKIRQITMDRFTQTIEYASIVNAKTVVFHSGYEKWKYALDVNLWLQKSLETWQPLNKLAKDNGIKIAIENIFEEDPSNLRLLMESIASDNFGVCFDTGHFNIFSTTPLTTWIDNLRQFIIELHVHDNNKSFDDHLPIFEGSFDFKSLFSLIQPDNLIITLEHHSPDDVMRSLQNFTKIFT